MNKNAESENVRVPAGIAYVPFFIDDKNRFAARTVNFNDTGDAARFLVSPEYRKAMGGRNYGVRVDFQSSGLTKEESLDWYRNKGLGPNARKLIEKGFKFNEETLKDMARRSTNRARLENRFFTDVDADGAEDSIKKYLDFKDKGTVGRSRIVTFETPEGTPEPNKLYSLKGGKPNNGILEGVMKSDNGKLRPYTQKEVLQWVVDNVDSMAEKLYGRKLGLTFSTNPRNELFVSRRAAWDPDFVKERGAITSAVDGSPPNIQVTRPAYTTRRPGVGVARGLGAIGTVLQLKDQIDAVTGRNGNSYWDKEYGGSDPLALRPLIDATLGNASIASTTNNPEWVMRNPLAAAVYGAAQGGNEYSKAFLDAYIPGSEYRKAFSDPYIPAFFKGKKKD